MYTEKVDRTIRRQEEIISKQSESSEEGGDTRKRILRLGQEIVFQELQNYKKRIWMKRLTSI